MIANHLSQDGQQARERRKTHGNARAAIRRGESSQYILSIPEAEIVFAGVQGARGQFGVRRGVPQTLSTHHIRVSPLSKTLRVQANDLACLGRAQSPSPKSAKVKITVPNLHTT